MLIVIHLKMTKWYVSKRTLDSGEISTVLCQNFNVYIKTHADAAALKRISDKLI